MYIVGTALLVLPKRGLGFIPLEWRAKIGLVPKISGINYFHS